jgi:hypothetical protein
MPETEHPCIRCIDDNNCDQKMIISNPDPKCPFPIETAQQCPDFQDKNSSEYTHIAEILKKVQNDGDKQTELYRQQLENMRENNKNK